VASAEWPNTSTTRPSNWITIVRRMSSSTHGIIPTPQQTPQEEQQAFTRYTAVGAPEADEIRATLAATDGPAPSRPAR